MDLFALFRGVVCTLAGAGLFVMASVVGRRMARSGQVTRLEFWSIVLGANGLLAHGLSQLITAGVFPADPTTARWAGDGGLVLVMAGAVCNVAQLVTNQQREFLGQGNVDTSAVNASVGVATQTASSVVTAPPAVVPSAAVAQAPAEAAVQTVGQRRN